MTLLILLMAHHVGDLFQPGWLIRNKRTHRFAIYEHVMAYTAIMFVALQWLGMFEPWMAAWIGVGHFTIDLCFYQLLPSRNGGQKPYWWVYPDQALHYAQIVILLAVA